MKNITFIIRSLRFGGAERVLTEICNYLNDKYNISIITFNEELMEYRLSEHIQRINLDLDISLYNLTKNIKVIKRAGIKTNPDLIISFDTLANLYTLMAFKKEKIKVGIAERNAPKQMKLRMHTKIMRYFLYKNADFYIFQTYEAGNFFAKFINNNAYYIANPVKDNIPYKAIESKNEIVAIGRLNYQKNYPFLIDVFAEFCKENKDYVLRIFGEGSDRFLLEKKCEKLGIQNNVVFEGNVEEIHKEIENSKIFVITSHFEGIPNALLETMAMGFPVVAIDCPVGGPNLLIQDGINGYLVKAGDNHTFLKRLNELVKNKSLSISLGNEAVKVRERFSIDNICNAWIDMIEKETK